MQNKEFLPPEKFKQFWRLQTLESRRHITARSLIEAAKSNIGMQGTGVKKNRTTTKISTPAFQIRNTKFCTADGMYLLHLS